MTELRREAKAVVKDRGLKAVEDQLHPIEGAVDPNHRAMVPEVYQYTLKQLTWLEEYKKDLDPKRAATAVGVQMIQVNRWMKMEHVTQILYKIQMAQVGTLFSRL